MSFVTTEKLIKPEAVVLEGDDDIIALKSKHPPTILFLFFSLGVTQSVVP